jgi:mannosyltransferase OCH1-like enzyme
MIPKIIHYCWFGGNPLPLLAVKCMNSWKKHCGDFEIKEWNESNFNVNFNRYSREAAQTNQWAFVADIARLWIIYNHGGVYLDVDVEVIKPIDEFLNEHMFLGFERYSINMGSGFGAEKNFYLLNKMLNFYDNISFINPDGTLNMTASPAYTNDIMEAEGFLLNNTKQTLNDVTVYPTEYFSAKDWESGDINITENTYTIHHYLASWWSEERKREHRRMQKQLQMRKNLMKQH